MDNITTDKLSENEINISLPHSSWSENLKQVITNSSYQAMLDNRDLQIAGKAGDEEAAKKIVSKISDINIIKKLATDFPNATVVPIPSMETADKKPNAIPLAYAEQFEQFGLNVADDIIEIDSIHHTGKKAFKRVVNRPHFDGNIQAGKEYIIVDDVYAMGGTVNSMRSFIENKGGKVVAVSTLTPSVENSKILAITEEHLDQLKEIDKNGELKNAIRNLDISENFESLTDPIGQYIFNNREKIINEDRTRRAKNDSKEHVKENSRNFIRKIDNTSNNIEKVLKEDKSYHVKYFNNIPVQQLSGNNLSEHLVKTLSETPRIKNEEFIELKTTNKKLGERFGDAVKQSNNVLIRIKDDISVYNAKKRLQEKINNLPKEKGINVKDGMIFLYFEKNAKFISAEIKNGRINILPSLPSLADLTESRPTLSNIAHSSDKSSPQSMVQNGNTYGFAYEGKIYLNPEIWNSEVAVHEYTHLWDNYIQRTNPELWERGKSIFKNTKFWDEVKADPNYADIAYNDDLLLSEVHSRICGKIAVI